MKAGVEPSGYVTNRLVFLQTPRVVDSGRGVVCGPPSVLNCIDEGSVRSFDSVRHLNGIATSAADGSDGAKRHSYRNIGGHVDWKLIRELMMLLHLDDMSVSVVAKSS